MPTASRRRVLLLNEAALCLPLTPTPDPDRDDVIVAGRSLVQLTLAELALPGAQMIWTDFRQSASLGRLNSAIHAKGGLDHLILAGDGHEAEAAFSAMCAVLFFLPALRRVPGSTVSLHFSEGPSMTSLEQFLTRLSPRLRSQSIRLNLSVLQRPLALVG